MDINFICFSLKKKQDFKMISTFFVENEGVLNFDLFLDYK